MYIYIYESSIWITSPIPEEAPVMWTTLPATFSGKNVKIMERKNLKVQYGGKKRSKEKKVNGGATMFRNWWIRSITNYTLRKKKIIAKNVAITYNYISEMLMLNLKLKLIWNFGIYKLIKLIMRGACRGRLSVTSRNKGDRLGVKTKCQV